MDTGERAEYEQWHARRGVDEHADSPWHRLLKPHLKLGGRRVLEIASGRGGFAVWMARRQAADRPAQLVAADFSFNALSAGRRFAADAPVVFAQADIMRLPFGDRTFDAVVSCETLEHTPDPVAAIAELHRVMRPGGVLYLTMPNYFGTLGVYRRFRELTGRPWQETGQRINHPLRAPRMRRWLTSAGFVVDALDGTGHFLPVPGRQPVNISALDGIRVLRPLAQHVVFVAHRAA